MVVVTIPFLEIIELGYLFLHCNLLETLNAGIEGTLLMSVHYRYGSCAGTNCPFVHLRSTKHGYPRLEEQEEHIL
jgi:hypothetical protein